MPKAGYKWKAPEGYYRRKRKELPYFKSEKYKAANRARSARYQRRNRVKVRCRRRVWAALKAGRMVRPDHCTRCGVICKPQAHHPDYTKPFDVQWACRPCHFILDRRDELRRG